MSLYDQYNLVNSTKVKQYPGSVVPELVQVSQELQRRYDSAMETQDYISRFMNSMQVLEKDRPVFQEWVKEHRNKLNVLSRRPDLENSLRETMMLARDVPEGYGPFAQRLKDYQTRQEELKKATEEGKIMPETASSLLARDLFHDKGIKLDPMTGRYAGRFTGLNYVGDTDMRKKVDDIMEKALPITQGYSHERVGDQWIVKKGGKVIEMPANKIQSIIGTGLSNDPEALAWIKQQQDLGTFNVDFSKVETSKLSKEQQNAVKKITDSGMNLTDAMKSIKKNQVATDILNRAVDYGISKYRRRDVETETGIKDNPYALRRYGHDLEDTTIPIAASIFQPTSGSTIANPAALDREIKKSDQANAETYGQYLQWLNLNQVKANGSPYDGNTRWFDEKGNERTSEARKFIDAQLQASRMSQELEKKRESAMKRANFVITPALRKEAELAYEEAHSELTAPSAGTGAPGHAWTDYERQRNGEIAYKSVLENSPGFKRYEKLLEEDSKAGIVPIGISTFKSKKLNEAIESTFNNLSVNLDANGLKYGAQGLQWGSGPDTGKQLSADDYEKVVGQAKFAGVGIDVDGSYKMFFKVGTSKTDSKANIVGEDILVKMPAYTGIAENLVKEGQSTAAQQYLAQSIGQIQSSPEKMVNLPLGQDKSVKVREVLPSEKSTLHNNPAVNYIITYYGNNGQSKEVTARSADEVVRHIIESLKNQ